MKVKLALCNKVVILFLFKLKIKRKNLVSVAQFGMLFENARWKVKIKLLFAIRWLLFVICDLLSVTFHIFLAIWNFFIWNYYLWKLVSFARCCTSRNFFSCGPQQTNSALQTGLRSYRCLVPEKSQFSDRGRWSPPPTCKPYPLWHISKIERVTPIFVCQQKEKILLSQNLQIQYLIHFLRF